MTSTEASLDRGKDLAADREELAERTLEILLDTALEPIVDMVLVRRDGAYEALAHDGRVRFRRDGRGGHEVLDTDGAAPLADQSTHRFVPLAAEVAEKHPHRSRNAYPHAFEHIAQVFDHPAAPELCVIHSAAHNWEEAGGHRGEHGSLDLVQARAPFVLAGKGVRADGYVPRSTRLVDLAPTLAALLGCAPLDDDATCWFAVQDGEPIDDLLDPSGGRPTLVVGFLFDGTNTNVLYDLAQRGEAPNVARLVEMGTAFGQGAISSLPTITLANHTTILTSAHPGHHGILNNAWYDRRTEQQIITNSEATWHVAMESLEPGIESLHTAIHRTWPDAFTASVNEPCDIGADYSTFDFFRRGEVPPIPRRAEGLPHVTERFVRPSKDYSWSSIVDHLGMEQAVAILDGEYRGVSYPPPRFLFLNFTLTDSAMHDGGPHSEIAAAAVRDCDARIGEVLAAVERTGRFDDTAFLLCADHGMEETDPTVRGDWDVALREAGLPFRDEAYGFLYLGDE